MKQDSNNNEKKKKKTNYKAKRSFTRNKKLRRDEPGKFGEGFKRSFPKKEGAESWKKRDKGSDRFEKDTREGGKDKRAERKEKFAGRDRREESKRFGSKPREEGKRFGSGKAREEGKSFGARKERSEFGPRKEYKGGDRREGGKKDFKERRTGSGPKDFTKKGVAKPTYAEKGLIRLNRYIANAGVCSRREADDLIATGCVSVNGKIVTELGYKVKEGDVVTYGGEKLKTEKHAYLLLNKPKDYITTSDDDRGRRTVMELIAGAVKERVYPVGRLDRNTTGLLLFTNDGELAKKLTHPQHNVQKLYHVELDKNLKQDDLLKIQKGIELEDGFIQPDEIAYAGESKREVGIMIHSGRNRIVRRIFETLGYDVVRLDRTMFAGLTKKNLPRGRWRLLTDKEISFLKMI